ncbi:hypothetical protein CK505_16015 [Kocuria sp. WN036]|jgi:hypothetical protein|uniref:hypothetical protein n=1 Tax=Kocuria TaxID=57493 RepID=UPI000BAB2C80|nr:MULTISPECIES: hypothetical protein [Kocuria]NVC25612.1 hypothetical protein [Kocuria salina]PAU86873.1 hypothetical protein CK505_16015 [Kocuria sp. WN036]THE19210.1 hypothetical protein E1J17_02000 [Kocuria rosea]
MSAQPVLIVIATLALAIAVLWPIAAAARYRRRRAQLLQHGQHNVPLRTDPPVAGPFVLTVVGLAVMVAAIIF